MPEISGTKTKETTTVLGTRLLNKKQTVNKHAVEFRNLHCIGVAGNGA